MKLKRLPEDFIVDERAEVSLSGGPFSVYRLTKRSLGTPEAVDVVLRHWKLPRQRVSYGGLKDRHAQTSQWLTIEHGPQKSFRARGVQLHYLGRTDRPFDSQQITANAFQIVLRDLVPREAELVEASLPQAVEHGTPNYFDDQRFGSLGPGRQFVAHRWCQGQDEQALFLALAEPNPHDRPRQRTQKQILRDNWGQWARCEQLLAKTDLRRIVTYLAARPHDFRGATLQLRADLRRIHVAAFQSYLWNELLAEWLRRTCREDQLVDVATAVGVWPFYRELDEPQRESLGQCVLPLPSARQRITDEPLGPLLDRLLEPYGLEQRQLQLKHQRDVFFSKGERRAIFFARDASAAIAADDLYPGRRKVRLQFELSRGCYATTLIRRLTLLTHASRREPIDWSDEGD